MSTLISWIPAHPAYDSISMKRYWRLLDSAIQANDPFLCKSILSKTTGEFILPSGRAKRLLVRKMIYPVTTKLRACGEICHILDHSWADLLPFIQKSSLKIVTVHDLIPLRFPGELTPSQLDRYRKWVGHLKSADALIAVSEYTKREVVDILGIDSQKIHVVFNGVDISSNTSPQAFKQRHSSKEDFRIGSIGSTLERKNLAILPEALARLQASIHRKVILVRAGHKLPNDLKAKIETTLGEGGLIELGKISDDDIHDFYAELDVLVVPSLYEGFGLPVIEGMAARIPVACSNSSSLPEVGADLAFYFDPHSPEELASVLAKIAKEGVSHEHLDMGYERAKGLSWRKCLEGIYQVYYQVIDEKRCSIS
jgi:glycosyltransferase involved in cell wall biosynthesis